MEYNVVDMIRGKGVAILTQELLNHMNLERHEHNLAIGREVKAHPLRNIVDP